MRRMRAATTFVGGVFLAVACHAAPAAAPPRVTPSIAAAQQLAPLPMAARENPAEPPPYATAPSPAVKVAISPPRCAPADWSPRKLSPLLKSGKGPPSSRPDQPGAAQLVFDDECSDSPRGPLPATQRSVVIDGVEIRLVGATPAGTSRRGWDGNQCSFELGLADGSGVAVRLDGEDVPPFTTVNSLVRAGSAAWLAIGFNGYTREFPQGGNRILAVDLCDGRVVWRSKDAMSNGGLLLVGDYLVSPYGFTSERRYVYVLDAHSGSVVQRLPVVENVCPSKSWAPHWQRGERCDAPGQFVGAATGPRIDGGVFFVDTNTGSAAFAIN
jgi:hypothetical protein